MYRIRAGFEVVPRPPPRVGPESAERLDDHHPAFAAAGQHSTGGLVASTGPVCPRSGLGRRIDARERAAQCQLLPAHAVSKEAVCRSARTPTAAREGGTGG